MDEPTPKSSLRSWEELVYLTIPHYVSGALLLAAAAINIANVVGRYVFFTPIFWAEEVLTFIVIWAVFIVAPSVTYRGAHLCMDLIYNVLPRQLQILVNCAIALTFITCTGFTATQSWKVVSLHWRTYAVTAGTDIPLFVPHAALLYGFSMMTIAVLLRLKDYVFRTFG